MRQVKVVKVPHLGGFTENNDKTILTLIAGSVKIKSAPSKSRFQGWVSPPDIDACWSQHSRTWGLLDFCQDPISRRICNCRHYNVQYRLYKFVHVQVQ